MFSTKSFAIAAATLTIAAAGLSSANAAPRHNGYHGGYNGNAGMINYRISNQHRRIRRGRRSGRINWVEARKLRFELSHIRTFKQSYLRDGRLNWRETRHLNALLNSNSRRIRRMATNGFGGWRPWRPYRQQRTNLLRYNGFQY